MKFLSAGLLVLFLTMMVNPGVSGMAWATFENLFASKSYLKDPRFPIKDKESFRVNTKAFHKIPFNDTKLEFIISLPKDWITEKSNKVKKSSGKSRRFLGDIIFARSPILNAAKAIFSVQFVSLEREISAQNWLKNYAHMSNYYIDGEVEAVNNKQANMHLVYMYKGQIVYSYVTLHINRNVAVMAQIRLPASLKEPMKFLQKEAIDSFRLAMPSDDPVETQEYFSFNEAMRVSYPSSWKLFYPRPLVYYWFVLHCLLLVDWAHALVVSHSILRWAYF